jgi:hypothetical protein
MQILPGEHKTGSYFIFLPSSPYYIVFLLQVNEHLFCHLLSFASYNAVLY